MTADRADGGRASLAGMADEEALRTADEELPVVARLVIEIRSDGSRTVARGGLENAELGERVAIEARGGSPAALAANLLRSILTLPLHSSLSRWTGRKGQAEQASIAASAEPAEASAGIVGRVRRGLSGRLRKIGLSR